MSGTPDGLDPRWDRDLVRPFRPKIASAAHSEHAAAYTAGLWVGTLVGNAVKVAVFVVLLPFWVVGVVLVACLTHRRGC